jgi:hypothetical protein
MWARDKHAPPISPKARRPQRRSLVRSEHEALPRCRPRGFRLYSRSLTIAAVQDAFGPKLLNPLEGVAQVVAQNFRIVLAKGIWRSCPVMTTWGLHILECSM